MPSTNITMAEAIEHTKEVVRRLQQMEDDSRRREAIENQTRIGDMEGQIQTIFEVSCARCGWTLHPPTYTKAEAGRYLREQGWKTRDSLWVCDHCVAKEKGG